MLDFVGQIAEACYEIDHYYLQIFVAEAGIVAVEAVKHFLSVCQRNE